MIQQSLEQLAAAYMDKEDLRLALEAAEQRPFGQYGIGIDWYRRDHRVLPAERARYCVAIFEWRIDGRWHRVRKLTGPRLIAQIQGEVEFQSKRLGHPIITNT